MNKSHLLLEIGCEELPEKQLDIAIGSVESQFAAFLAENKLHCENFQASGTPRRVYLNAQGLDLRQKDEEIIKTGPAISIAFTQDGKLSPAGIGFLKKNQAEEDAVYTQKTEKGSFVAIRYTKAGKSSAELIKAWIPQMLWQIPFAKRMIWNSRNYSFSRPLRWILCLWQDQTLDLEIPDIVSGDISFGNRYLGLDKALQITRAADYYSSLSAAAVIPSMHERRDMIRTQLKTVLGNSPYEVIEDERLVITVANLVEYPTAVVGEFEAEYLKLPEKIIISTISQNQKYFSVQDSLGKLTNRFVFVANGNPQYSQLIRKGNEKVVKARLADALWYYNEDTKQPLQKWSERLSEVVFQAKLGTLADKTKRILGLVESITSALQASETARQKALRCALLCKADLVTNMLGEKEFTKLQGYIGMQYALAEGEEEEVAIGIYEHYMPRGSADELPSTHTGSIVAIADKLDTVAGIIGIGLLPTGSGDPFALRRAANGIVQIISAQGWDIDLFSLADEALEQIGSQTELEPNARGNLHGFLEQRVVGLLKNNGIAYDVVDSVMHIEKSRINDLEQRAKALNALRTQPEFIQLVIGFKRVANIIADTKEFAELDPTQLTEAAEQTLYTGLITLHKDIDLALQNKDYPQALRYLIDYGKAIDEFFEAILVNCDDFDLKANRHALLKLVKNEFLRVADLSLIVLESEQQETR